MSLQNSVLEASGVDFGGLGPPFWKVLGSIFEGFGPWKPPESSSEASGLHFGRSWTSFSAVWGPGLLLAFGRSRAQFSKVLALGSLRNRLRKPRASILQGPGLNFRRFGVSGFYFGRFGYM